MTGMRAAIDPGSKTAAIGKTRDKPAHRPITLAHLKADAAGRLEIGEPAQPLRHDLVRPALPNDSSISPRRIMKMKSKTPGSAASVVSK